MEGKTREELEQEIATVQEELDADVSELETVNAQLGITPENEGDYVPDDSELGQKKKALEEAILIKQMKIVALKKSLNDASSNEAMSNASKEE